MTYESDTAADLAGLAGFDHANRRTVHDDAAQYFTVDFIGYYEGEPGLDVSSGYNRHQALITLWCEPVTGRTGEVMDRVIELLCESSRHRAIEVGAIPLIDQYLAQNEGQTGTLIPLTVTVTEA